MIATVTENQTFDEERAFYGERDVELRRCSFDGEADGESAFKECTRITVDECYFNLRYPFWHDSFVKILNCRFTENCRAALWYSDGVTIKNSSLHGIKALRECTNVSMAECSVSSSEFGWSTKDIVFNNCTAEGEYFMLRGKNISANGLHLKGKYSFQYIEDSDFTDCTLNTKDSLWHAKNVTLKNCTVTGEYLGWYCENVTFINCTLVGTQPLCYCKNLKLIDCKMIDADLAFEKSEVYANLLVPIVSIKNPLEGEITVPSAEEIIMDDENAKGKIRWTGTDTYL